MQNKKPRVLVAMSGGVDSSVAAFLLKKQGYNVLGAFMKNWSDTKDSLGECAWRGERRMALKIASMVDVPLITLDFEKEYKKLVVEKMFKGYKKGITPNPDIECNEKIKFPLLIKALKKFGCDFIATGHYARIKRIADRKIISAKNSACNISGEGSQGDGGGDIKKNCQYQLLRAKDESKDQSYFLYRIKQNELKEILFPIGEYTKKEIREIAKKNKFPNYGKKSTVGICFIGKVNLKNFLRKKIRPKKGEILNPEGKQVGEHDGIYYYTIGQRIGPRFGIEISKNEKIQRRWYVAKKIPATNTIIAAPEGHRLNFRKEIYIKNPHWINESPKNNGSILSRIRQVGELLPSKLEYKNGKFKITLDKAITGVSEGQAIVLYRGEKCLGGGEIRFR